MVILEDTPLLTAWEKYRKAVDHRFYQMSHWALLVILFEVLVRIFWVPKAVEYNGADLWFKLPFHWLPLPGGTLLIAVILLGFWGFYLFLDWKGIKDRKEREKDKKDKKEHEDKEKRRAGKVVNEFKSKDKEAFSKKINLWYWGGIILEGFVYSVVIFSLLDLFVFALTYASTGEVVIPPTLDRNPELYDLHSNPGLDLALAIGAGIYEEGLFRWLLPIFLTWVLTTFVKNFQVTPMKLTVAGTIIYALSHYLPYFGDYLSFYSFGYRLAFGFILNTIYQRRKLAVAAWTHVIHDGFYFLLR